MSKILIKCGELYDGVHDEFQKNKEILVEDNKILEVGENLKVDGECEIIDLSDQTVTPGLIDNHVHIDYPAGLKIEELAYVSNSATTLHTLVNLQKTLLGGFTTIRGMNSVGRDRGIFEVKKQQDKGYFKNTSRLVPARVMGTEGGHADASGELVYNEEIAEAFKSDAVGSGSEFFRQLVRNDIKYGAGFIKFMYSGGFFTQLDGPEDCQMSDEEVQSIINTTHDLNRTCTAHCYGDKLVNKLLDFGIDGVEHGALITEETARRFEETDTYLVPTFLPFSNIIYMNEESLNTLSPAMIKKLTMYKEQLTKSRKVILNSKIRLGYGSDIVGTMPITDTWREYSSWIESGAEPLRILKAATFENARILGKLDEIGTIEPGKIADIAGFKGDLNQQEGIKNCGFVMKEGTVYKNEGK